MCRTPVGLGAKRVRTSINLILSYERKLEILSELFLTMMQNKPVGFLACANDSNVQVAAQFYCLSISCADHRKFQEPVGQLTKKI